MRLFSFIFLAFLLSGCQSSSDFNLNNETIVSDIQSKWVVLNPQGQLWGFSSDQKIDISIIDKKLSSDKADIAAQLTAVANIPQPPEPTKEQTTAEQPKTPKEVLPLKVMLNGVVKLHYEKIGGKWYLIEIEGISLMVSPSP